MILPKMRKQFALKKSVSNFDIYLLARAVFSTTIVGLDRSALLHPAPGLQTVAVSRVRRGACQTERG